MKGQKYVISKNEIILLHSPRAPIPVFLPFLFVGSTHIYVNCLIEVNESIFLLCHVFHRHYLIFLALVTWTYFDRATPISGGRRSAWVRNWGLFRNMVEYFPMKLVKTTDLDPKNSYLFGFHPHGIMGVGLFAHFASEGSNFSQIFPGITPYALTLNGWFYIPIIRDYLMLSGKHIHTMARIQCISIIP